MDNNLHLCSCDTEECIGCGFYNMCNTIGKPIFVRGVLVAVTGGEVHKLSHFINPPEGTHSINKEEVLV